MMKAILLFAMISTVMGLRRAPAMPKQVHINPMGTSVTSFCKEKIALQAAQSCSTPCLYQNISLTPSFLCSLSSFSNRPKCNCSITAYAGIDDIDADLEYELLTMKYQDGVSPVKRVVEKPVKEKQLRCVPAKGVLFGIEHVEELDQICFLE